MIGMVGRWIPCVVLALLAGAAVTGLVREAAMTRPLPPPSIAVEPHPSPILVVARQALGGPVETAHYAVIAARNLFAVSRGEQTAMVAAATGPKPFLHGVVLDGPLSRAYLEDPVGQRVSGYALGDAVGGGKLVSILDDRVVIRRPEGLVEVMLKDPAKPQPAPPAAAGPAAAGSAAADPAPPAASATPAAPATDVAAPSTPPQGPK
jgi:hypothetical protein